jgi:hypothetical protein
VGAFAFAIASLHGVNLRYAFRDEPFYLLGWLFVVTIPALLSIWSIRALVPFIRLAMTRTSDPTSMMEATEATKYLGVWSRQDEAIIGLSASGSFAIQFLSNSTVDQSSRGKSHRRPIATAINQLVNNILSRKVQGSSLNHLELRTVLNCPHLVLAHKPLHAEADNEIIFNADCAAASLGRRVRELLLAGRDPVTGFEDLQCAAAGAFTFKELVHTSYFHSKSCVDLIKHHVQNASKYRPAESSGHASQATFMEWYSSRLAHDSVHVASKGIPITPSNKVGYAVALSSVAMICLMSLATLSLKSIHTIALEPTTPTHQLRAVVNTENILHALVGTDPDEASPMSLAYLRSIAQADQIPLLMRIAMKESPVQLAWIFQSNGLVPLLRVANGKQIVWLLRNYNAQFVIKRRDQITSLAPLIEATRGLVSEGALNEDSYALLQAACGENEPCTRVIANQVARELSQRANSFPAYLLPLPEDLPSVFRHSSCRDNLGIGDCNSSPPANRAERAKAANRFWGQGGTLSVLSPFAISAPISSTEFEIALSALRSHLCLPMNDRGSPDINDEVRLSRVFQLAPKEALARPALDEWTSIINGDKDLCGSGQSDSGSADVNVPATWFTLTMADWVARFDPKLAKDIVLPRVEQGHYPMGMERRLFWLLRQGYAADVRKLFASYGMSQLVARATYFEIATCLQLAGKSDDAVVLANGAEAITPVERDISPEIVTIARAEAMYHIARGDWRRAFNACKNCDAEKKVQFSSSMLQFATSDAPQELVKRELSCPQDLDAAKPSASEVSQQAGAYWTSAQ